MERGVGGGIYLLLYDKSSIDNFVRKLNTTDEIDIIKCDQKLIYIFPDKTKIQQYSVNHQESPKLFNIFDIMDPQHITYKKTILSKRIP